MSLKYKFKKREVLQVIKGHDKRRQEKLDRAERREAKTGACSAGECRQRDMKQPDKLEMTLLFCLVRQKLCLCLRLML